jgi:hypothetical protein
MEVQPPNPPLDKFTKHPLIVGLVCAIIGALASGMATAYFSPNWESTARGNQWVSVAEWQAIAEKKGWILKNDCPSIPVSLNISSPGDGARLTTTIDYK